MPLAKAKRGLHKVVCWFWGDITIEEFEKFGILSATFLFIIGTYWMIRVLKNAIFVDIVGIDWIPRAKILSLCVLIPLILIYSKLVDIVEKHKLFYIIGTTYAIAFAGIAYALSLPGIGLDSGPASYNRLLGWVVYVTIESFGSLMVALFWSFVTSSTDSASAKRGFPLIVFGAQFGSITGPTIVKNYASVIGIPTLFGLAVFSICMIMAMIALFMRVIPRKLTGEAEEAKVAKKPKTGMIEGLKLIFTRPYVLGVFGIATLYEIIGTVIDYQMQVLAVSTYTTPAALAGFNALFGQFTNGLALMFALFGTSYFMRKFGLTFCLLLFPITVGLVVICIYFYQSLWIVFAGMVAIKGLSYALNNPAKEMMYIPTSKDVRFKAKGWIDMFGNRSAKGAGSAVNDTLKGMPNFMAIGTVISLAVVGFWLMVAGYVGKKNSKLVKEGKVVE